MHDSLLLLSAVPYCWLLPLVHRLTFCISFSALWKKELSFKLGELSGWEYWGLTWWEQQYNYYCLFYSRIQVVLLKLEPFRIRQSTNKCNADFFSSCFELWILRIFLFNGKFKHPSNRFTFLNSHRSLKGSPVPWGSPDHLGRVWGTKLQRILIVVRESQGLNLS